MAYTKDDFTVEFCRALVEEYGNIQSAAQAVADLCYSPRYSRVPAWRTVMTWISNQIGPMRLDRAATRAANDGMGVGMSRPNDPDRVNRIDDLLDRANVPLEELGAIDSATLKAYGGYMKGPDGQPVKVPLYSTTIRVRPPNPEFPVVQPAPTTSIVFAPPVPRIGRRVRSIPIVSDIQAGFLRNTTTQALEPIHDPAAIDVAQQIVHDLGPDQIVFIGDVADLSPFSRWGQHPEYHGTLQPSVNVVHEILGGFIAAAGTRCTKRMMIGSNHDHRIEKGVLEWNKEALGVRRAGTIDGWPVFSLGYLARFDDLGLEWSGQYPGGEFFLLDDLAIMHAPPKSREFAASVIHGHTHKLEQTACVQHAKDGRRVQFVYDVGCLCQVGATSEKFRLLVTKVPSDRGRTDWTQGIAVVNVIEASGSRPAYHSVDLVKIVDGQATFGGKDYTARAGEA